MSEHKRSSDAPTDDELVSQHHRKLPGVDDEELKRSRTPSTPSLSPAVAVEERRQPYDDGAAVVDKQDSDFSNQPEEQELSEYIYIDLQEIRKEVQCPICLGIIKKTRTVMECLHRFCRQCIDKSMRMGNNECPACRTHCASRRSLRDDPRFDAFITTLFPDIEKYEEEELAFCEEERTRNKQIQASIAEILTLQSEALGKNRSSRKGTGVAPPSRSRRNNSDTPSRRNKRRRSGKTLLEESDDNEDLEITEEQTSSFSGDHSKEIDQYRHKTRRRVSTSRPTSPATSSESENKLGQKTSHPGIMWNMETRAWGKGGARSHIPHASANGLLRKNPPSTHLSKLVKFLQNSKKQDDEYVVSEMPTGADKQVVAATEPTGLHHRQAWLHLSSSGADQGSLSVLVDQFRQEKKTITGFEVNHISHGGQLVSMSQILACQHKEDQ